MTQTEVMKPNTESAFLNAELSSSPDLVPVFIAYDQPESARRALELTQRLASQLASRVKIHPNLWRIDLLNAPGGYQTALRWAIDADVLLLAMKGSDDFPEFVRAWLGEVLMQRGHRRTALVALFGEEEGDEEKSSPAVQRLTAMAHNSGADLFAQPVNRLPDSTSWLVHGTHSPSYRWGINE